LNLHFGIACGDIQQDPVTILNDVSIDGASAGPVAGRMKDGIVGIFCEMKAIV
jgi:hypothetical protein